MYRFTLNENRLKLKNVNTIQNRKKEILELALYLDTETSHNHNIDNLKAWIESICFEFNNEVVILRKPSQFIKCLNKIKEFYKLNENKKLIIYCHNLSYDLSYLKDFLIKEYGTDYKILALAPHKFISFEIDCFIFKCSYKLSNKSLAKWGKDLNIEHKKLENSVDYDKINYQNTELEKQEIKYQYYDVLALKECILKQLEIYNDNLLTVPLTSTGYIRREILRNYKKDRHNNRKFFDKTRLTVETYKFLKNAFSGGYTHGNRFLKKKL